MSPIPASMTSAVNSPTQLDLGGITTARGPEHLVPLLLAVYGALGTTTVNTIFVR